MPASTLKPNEPVKVWYETEGATHIHRGIFIALDETGLMTKAKTVPVYQFIPRERVVMIEQIDQTSPMSEPTGELD